MTRPAESAREAVSAVAARLRDSGHVAYLAGGCVRDRLLGLEPDEFDLATDARPEEIQRLFPGSRGVGESFGVVLVRRGEHVFDVATFRTEGAYSDGRRPSSVSFTDAANDALRRDFTINGLFEDPLTGGIVDFVGGQADLEARLLRAIGDPDARFAEDHLRLLRGVRFAARHGLAIEPRTRAAMLRDAPRLAGIARERIGIELRKMLAHPSRVRAVGELESLGLDAPALGGPPTPRIGRRLDRLPETCEPVAALAAWLLDRAGPDEAAEVPAATVARVRDALTLSNDESERLAAILARRRELIERPWDDRPVAARKRFLAAAGSGVAIGLLELERPGLGGSIDRWVASVPPAELWPASLVSGDDLVRLGHRPGPRFRILLEAAFDAQLDGRVRTREEALAHLAAIARDG
jgi:poly(A) polymerase